MATNNVVEFPKEKQSVPSALEQAKKVYSQALADYDETCRYFRLCGNLRGIAHHKLFVEASDVYIILLKNEMVRIKNLILKGFLDQMIDFIRVGSELRKVSSRRNEAQTMANEKQF
jgi:hypothetical protein